MAKWKRICGIYALISSIAMPLLWLLFFMTGIMKTELTQPVNLTMLLIAESLTVITLFLSGIGLLKKKPIGLTLFPVSMGMLIYACLLAMGKFGQKGHVGLMVFFGIITVASLVMTGVFVRNMIVK